MDAEGLRPWRVSGELRVEADTGPTLRANRTNNRSNPLCFARGGAPSGQAWNERRQWSGHLGLGRPVHHPSRTPSIRCRRAFF